MTDEAILDGQRRLWGLGDYGAVARHLSPISVELIAAAGIGLGSHVLDIAVGDGNTTICASRAGASVVGIDISPAQLELARARLAREGVDAELHEANAEALPFPDASFDAVVSSMGVIFAPDQAAAAAEMGRVCRPGGTVALTAWAGAGWSARLLEEARDLIPTPPPGAPRSEVWGDPADAVALLAAAGIEATSVEHDFWWAFASVDEALTFFRTAPPPFIALLAAADAQGTAAAVNDMLVTAIAGANEATDGSCKVPAPYLVLVGSTRETQPS